MDALAKKLHSLVIFRKLLTASPVRELVALLDTDMHDTMELNDRYAAFVEALYTINTDLAVTVEELIFAHENLYTLFVTTGKGDEETLTLALNRELKIFNEVARFDGHMQRNAIGDRTLPKWKNSPREFVSLYHARMKNVSIHGLGMFAKYHMFIMDDYGQLVPIKNPDPQSLSDMVGYERERGMVVANVEAFLKGLPANNMLLYGDAGTGKSSTVKGISNDYAAQGLRLVEMKKTQLYMIPQLMDNLATNPLKFIIFIDDLTFASDDRDFCALKAILEGGVNSRGDNILICATSNHRHMIKESMADRNGDAVNVADMMQEIVSLSARFGLTVTFMRSDKALYVKIVTEMAARHGIELSEDELIAGAEAFAIRGGGRNPRTAKQYIDAVLSGAVSGHHS